MLGFTFFGNRKVRQFEYRPRYYDPEKEEREERKKALLGEDYKDAYKKEGEAGEKEEYRPGQYIHQLHVRRGIIARRQQAEKKQTRMRRFIILLVLLVALGIWLLS